MPEALGRQIEFSPAPTTAVVLGDADKLKQVFINVVRNACEAIAQGEVVTWKVIPTQGQVCICVHNGGEPIPPDVLSKLTTPFYTTKPSGTGLGLAIVKRIVNAHRGEITIESSENEGTTVSVLLPTIISLVG